MKKVLLSYAKYNHWANKQLIGYLLTLPEDELRRPMVSSFPGVLPTVIHLWNAESIWYQRIRLSEHVEPPGDPEYGNVKEAAGSWLAQSEKWIEWLDRSSAAMLDHVFEYRSSKKELHKQAVWEALLHLFNHQSYHRGQLITLLRQSGMSKIPNTDFLSYSRKKRSVVVNDRVGNPV